MQKSQTYQFFKGLFTIFIFLQLCSLDSFSAERPLLDSLRNFFEWGEYEKIRVRVEHYLVNRSDPADSFFLAQCHKYLGVAYAAMGRLADAKEQFTKAYSFDPTITLDRYFVSQKIAELFSLTIEECNQRFLEQARRDSLMKLAEIEKHEMITLERLRRNTITYLITSYSGGAVLGSMAAMVYINARSLNDSFLVACDSGWAESYYKYKEVLQKTNYKLITLYSSAMSLVGLGTYFLYRLFVMPKKIEQRVAIEVMLTGEKHEVAVSFVF